MKFLKDIARIWNMFVERVLYILDPHKVNEELEYLRMQIQVERNEKMQIIDALTKKESEFDSVVSEATHAPNPINPYIPWRVRRAQLEAEHRIKKSDPEGIAASANRTGRTNSEKLKEDIKNLEEELEIAND